MHGLRPYRLPLTNGPARHPDRVFGARARRAPIPGPTGRMFDHKWVTSQVQIARRPEYAEEIYATVEKASAYLAARGIRLVVVYNPLEFEMAPQGLPAAAPRVPRPSSLDRLRARLGADSRWRFVDGHTVLAHAKEQAFFLTDGHMNAYGSSLLLKAIVDTVADWEGIGAAWTWSVEPEACAQQPGAYSRFMSLLVPMRDEQGYCVPIIYATDGATIRCRRPPSRQCSFPASGGCCRPSSSTATRSSTISWRSAWESTSSKFTRRAAGAIISAPFWRTSRQIHALFHHADAIGDSRGLCACARPDGNDSNQHARAGPWPDRS